MSNQITLPRDAEGREIPLDTEVLYDEKGNERRVYNYMFYPKSLAWIVNIETKDKPIYYAPTNLSLTPPDSWEKLLEDLDNAAEKASEKASNSSYLTPCCVWFNDGNGGCADCPADEHPNDSCNVQLVKNIAARIRSLRGEER